MSRSHFGMCFAAIAAIILLAVRSALPAQTLTSDKFDGDLRACAAAQKIELSADLSASIRQIYSGQGKSSFSDSTKFLSRIPEKDRLEAYRL
jgi:hypothetical protein